MLVERAPIPPHERSWRHPSELHSSIATPEPHGSSGRLIAVATGAVAATLVVVLAITILPRRAPAPVAVSATTLPPFEVSAAASVAADESSVERSNTLDQVRLEQTALASPTGLALTGAPRSIAVPVVAAEEPPAGELPADAVVHLVTSSHVYRLARADLDRTIAPDGTLVVDDRGHIVGSFVDGRFVAD